LYPESEGGVKTLPFSSLRIRLIVLALIAVLPLALVAIYRDYHEERAIRRQLTEDAKKFAVLSLNEEEQQIDRIRTFLVAISHSSEVKDGAYCDKYLKGLIGHYPDFSNIGVIGKDGMLIYSALPFKGPLDLSDRSYFRRALEKKEFSIGDYQVGRVTNKKTVNFGYPVVDRSGNVEAVTFVAVNVAALSTRFAGMVGGLFPKGTTITSVGPNGVIISRYPDEGGAVGRPASETGALKDALEGEGSTTDSFGPHGIPRLYLKLPLYDKLAGRSITVILGVPEADVFAKADRIFVGSLAMTAIVLALCITLAIKGGERYILSNIDRLADAAGKISRGELSARTGIPYGEGEMGRLARAVDDMASSLDKRSQDMADAIEAIRLGEAKYRSLVERVPAITYTTTVRDLNRGSTYVSPQVKSLLGYSPDELTSEPGSWYKLMHPADRERVTKEVESTYENGCDFVSEYRMLTMDGGYIWVHDEAALVKDETGKPLMYQGIMVDVTSRKKRELELEAIASLSSRLRKAGSLEEMPPIVLETVTELLNAECAALALSEGEGKWMTIRYGKGLCEDWIGRRLPCLCDAAGYGIERGEHCVFKAVSEDPLVEEDDDLGGITSSICSPIVFHGQSTGGLWVGLRSDVSDDDVRVVNAVCDIAANALHREKLFDLTERRLQKLYALRSIDMAITGSLDLNVILSVALDQVISQLDVDAADILFLNHHDNTLRFMAEKGFKTRGIRSTELRLGECMAGKAVLERRPVSMTFTDGRADGFTRAQLITDENFVSAFCSPLIAKGEIKGVIEVFNRSLKGYDDEWLDFLGSLSMQVAIAVDNAGMFEDIQRSHTELSVAYETTIEGWARALDYRDRETEGHSRRVTEITVEIARALGISDEQLVHIRRGALLHDIGKLGVPDSILLKPGPLTDEEWVIMKKHPVFAYELLSPIPYLRPAIDVPYCHHEKWDGSGYPQGLKGEHIPLGGRIFAVVDVWDALLSDRPYRKAWPEGKVREFIFSESGKHFDPTVVDVFLRMDWDKLKRP
jgi:PAS domain S-box-containing protein